MAITQDGAVSEVAYSAQNKLSTNTLACSNSGNVIFVVAAINGGNVTSVEDESANAFTQIKKYATTNVEIWARYYSGTFNSKVRVIANAAPGFATFYAWGINGLQSATVDANASSTNSGGSSPLTVSSDGANGLIVTGSRNGSTATPTEGSGWSKVIDTSSGYCLAQWRAFTGGALSGYSCSTGTGDGDVNGMVAAVFSDIVAGSSTSISGSAATSATGTHHPGISVAL